MRGIMAASPDNADTIRKRYGDAMEDFVGGDAGLHIVCVPDGVDDRESAKRRLASICVRPLVGLIPAVPGRGQSGCEWLGMRPWQEERSGRAFAEVRRR